MRIALIGCGSIGRRHLANLEQLGIYRVRVYDTNTQKSHDTQQFVAHGLPSLWRWKPEATLICTPPDTHVRLALDAVSAGSHIFIEKPLSDEWLFENDIEELILRLKHSSVMSMVGCNWRFRYGMQKLLAQPGPMRVKANVPIPPERRHGLQWDISWHFWDLALWSGRDTVDIEASYEEPYRVGISCGVQRAMWNANYDANKDYVKEVRQFINCVEHGRQPWNPVSEAAETLRRVISDA